MGFYVENIYAGVNFINCEALGYVVLAPWDGDNVEKEERLRNFALNIVQT